MRRQSYERFYYEKIALGEGCGCAEHVTRMRELDAYADGTLRRPPSTFRPLAALAFIASKLRLSRKRKPA